MIEFFNKILDINLRIVLSKIGLVIKKSQFIEIEQSVADIFGISQSQQLLKKKRFENGTISLEGNIINFNDVESLHGMVNEVYVRKNYDFLSAIDNPTIIDCGANIGISVLYFKKKFPNAKIIAFEPDRSAFECLSANIKASGNSGVELINSSIWIKIE